jgi:hypothetical protein
MRTMPIWWLAICALGACTSAGNHSAAAQFARAQPVVRTGSAWGVIVPLSSASGMLHLCRSMAGPVDSFWTPSLQEIKAAERGIEAYVGAHPPRYWGLDSHPQTGWTGSYISAFGRQYIGITRGNARFLLINVFEAVRHADIADQATRQVIRICDGGPNFLTIEFNETLGQFSYVDYGGMG